MRFFFDNCISPAIVRSLAPLCEKEFAKDILVHLTQEFPAAADDVDWLSVLAEQGEWTIVSGDERISRSPKEQEAWLSAGLTTFFLAPGWTNQLLWDQATGLIKAWPTIREAGARARPGAGFKVTLRGKVEVLPPIRKRRR